MPLRFRRRIKLLPGVHLNVSRSGISTSIGVRGASMTFGKRGTYVNTGIPGTGISYRERVPAPQMAGSQVAAPESAVAEATRATPPTDAAPVLHHHLHWWKIALFFGTMILAGATKNQTVIATFWYAWFAYWLFLVVRRIVRKKPKLENAQG